MRDRFEGGSINTRVARTGCLILAMVRHSWEVIVFTRGPASAVDAHNGTDWENSICRVGTNTVAELAVRTGAP